VCRCGPPCGPGRLPRPGPTHHPREGPAGCQERRDRIPEPPPPTPRGAGEGEDGCHGAACRGDGPQPVQQRQPAALNRPCRHRPLPFSVLSAGPERPKDPVARVRRWGFPFFRQHPRELDVGPHPLGRLGQGDTQATKFARTHTSTTSRPKNDFRTARRAKA
jgi:hypothetical protein